MQPVLTSSVKVENSSQCIQSVQIYFGYEIRLYVYWLLLTYLKFYVMKVSLCAVPIFDYLTDIMQSSNHPGLLICGCLYVFKLPESQISPWRLAVCVLQETIFHMLVLQ